MRAAGWIRLRRDKRASLFVNSKHTGNSFTPGASAFVLFVGQFQAWVAGLLEYWNASARARIERRLSFAGEGARVPSHKSCPNL